VKILCVSYEISQKLSEKPRSGGAYPIGPGLSGKTKAPGEREVGGPQGSL
jgi:hypothetical protein